MGVAHYGFFGKETVTFFAGFGATFVAALPVFADNPPDKIAAVFWLSDISSAGVSGTCSSTACPEAVFNFRTERRGFSGAASDMVVSVAVVVGEVGGVGAGGDFGIGCLGFADDFWGLSETSCACSAG
jgi:hypothetical protein